MPLRRTFPPGRQASIRESVKPRRSTASETALRCPVRSVEVELTNTRMEEKCHPYSTEAPIVTRLVAIRRSVYVTNVATSASSEAVSGVAGDGGREFRSRSNELIALGATTGAR